MAIRFCSALLLATLLAAGCQQETGKQASLPAAPAGDDNAAGSTGSRPVELELLDYDGIEQLVASHQGQVVVMDAWSLSCPPCIKEFPQLVALQQKFGTEVACVSLSFDYEGIGKPEDKVPAVRKFLESQHATFDNVLATDESDALYRKLRLTSVPAVFVYDRSGKLRKRFDNENSPREADNFTHGQVSDFVSELLAEKDESWPAGTPDASDAEEKNSDRE